MIRCFVCDKQLEFLFSLGQQPLANKYPASSEQISNEIIRNLEVFYCRVCIYLHIPCDIDRDVFFEDYYYLSSVNRELVQHFAKLANSIAKRGHTFVLDVGSNDGILLQQLKDLNIRCLGIDPSENVSKIANLSGLETIVGFFNNEKANLIKQKYGRPDLICASSVFTHLDDPRLFFSVAETLLAENGEILIEVEYLGDIINNLGFERFYFDRPHYYSVESLQKLGEQANFRLIDISFNSVHGGSVCAIFIRSQNETKKNPLIQKYIDQERRTINRQVLRSKFSSFGFACETLKKNLEDFRANGVAVGAYGCPARFSTITNFAGINRALLPYVVDDSKLKIGRFSPGMHVPIISFADDRKAEVYIVFAYEYIDSIKEKFGSRKARFMKPIPFESI